MEIPRNREVTAGSRYEFYQSRVRQDSVPCWFTFRSRPRSSLANRQRSRCTGRGTPILCTPITRTRMKFSHFLKERVNLGEARRYDCYKLMCKVDDEMAKLSDGSQLAQVYVAFDEYEPGMKKHLTEEENICVPSSLLRA